MYDDGTTNGHSHAIFLLLFFDLPRVKVLMRLRSFLF